jgi:predicted metalloprotease
MTAVFNDLNGYWGKAFARAGVRYRAPEPVWVPVGLTTDSNCGRASYPAEAFYCPGSVGSAVHAHDRIYVSLDWIQREIDQRPSRNPRFFTASIIAHMFGHHVQRSVGLVTEAGSRLCCQLDPTAIEANADCLAGVWAHARFAKEQADAASILQAMTVIAGTRDLEKFAPEALAQTGTPEGRSSAFSAGYETGDAQRCEQGVLGASRGSKVTRPAH